MTGTMEALPGTTALLDGHLACLACGVAVPPSRQAGVVRGDFLGTAPVTHDAADRGTVAAIFVYFTRCPDCARRDELAGALLDAHPAVLHRLGSGVARHRVNGALDALAVLGVRLPGDAADLDTMGRLLRNLALPGIAARWITKCAGRKDSAGTCAATSWSHVSDENRAHLRDGYAAVLAERVAATAPPFELAPPPPPPDRSTTRTTHQVRSGCLLCGVSSVAVDAVRVTRLGGPVRAAGAVWTPLTFRRGVDKVGGYLCPDCMSAKESRPAWGPSLFEFAYTRHLERLGRHEEARSLGYLVADGRAPDLPAFGIVHHSAAVAGRTPPSAPSKPWGHIKIKR